VTATPDSSATADHASDVVKKSQHQDSLFGVGQALPTSLAQASPRSTRNQLKMKGNWLDDDDLSDQAMSRSEIAKAISALGECSEREEPWSKHPSKTPIDPTISMRRLKKQDWSTKNRLRSPRRHTRVTILIPLALNSSRAPSAPAEAKKTKVQRLLHLIAPRYEPRSLTNSNLPPQCRKTRRLPGRSNINPCSRVFPEAES